MNMRKSMLSAVLLLCLTAASARTDNADSAALLTKAENLFKEASETANPRAQKERYLGAASLYEELVRAGVKNGKLYYNLGNSYMRAGVVGKAVLNYRRALLYTPSDRQLKHNLGYAREQQKNSLTPAGTDRITEILLLPFKTVPFMLSAAVLILASLALWLSVIGNYLKLKFRPLYALPVILMLFSGASLAFSVIEYRRPSAVITAAQTIGHNGDSNGYEATFSEPLYEGVECTVLEQRAGWYLVRLETGDMTWIESGSCEMVR